MRSLRTRAQLVAGRRLEGSGLQSGRRCPGGHRQGPAAALDVRDSGDLRRARRYQALYSIAGQSFQSRPVTLHIHSLHIPPGGWGVELRLSDTCRKSSHLARAPPVQNPTVPFGRPPGTAITGRHRNGGSRRRHGCSIEVAGHCIDRTDPLLDHPYHLDDPRRVTHPRAHLVTGRDCRRRLCRPIVDPHMATSARRGGVRPGLRQPDRPQPPVHAGRLHSLHHRLPTGCIGTTPAG